MQTFTTFALRAAGIGITTLVFAVALFGTLPASVQACGDGGYWSNWQCEQRCIIGNQDSSSEWVMCNDYCWDDGQYYSCSSDQVWDGSGCSYASWCDPYSSGGGGGDPSCEGMGMIGTYPNCSVAGAVLTAGQMSPMTAHAGVQQMFLSPVTNTGTADMLYGFFMDLYIYTPWPYWILQGTGTGTGGALAIGQSTNTYTPFTFASAGTYEALLCPRFDGNEPNTVAPNCVGGQVVVDNLPAPSASLSANPTTIVAGNSTQVSWSSSNTTSCTGDGNLNTGGATSGSVTSWPGASTTYHINCTGPAGSVDAYANVTVNPAQCSDGVDNDSNGLTDLSDPGCSGGNDNTESGGVLPSVSCNVNPTTVATGGSATYTATPANGATGPYTWTASDGATGLGTASTASRSFGSLGTYGMTVRATGAGNPSTTCPQVGVNSCSGTKTGTITANPTCVNQGSGTTLTWSAQNITTSCTVSGPGVSNTTSAASCNVPSASIGTPGITTQSVYTLTCDGTQVASVIVNVVPKIEEF